MTALKYFSHIPGCYDGCLYVLNITTGEIKWKYQTGGPIKSSPAVDLKSSLVIFGSHDHHLFGVDIQVNMQWYNFILGLAYTY